MKIIKEELQEIKEELPIEFITTFISKGWDEIGTLKASTEGILKDFVGAEKVAEILQDLSDAYLICIGRLQGYLHNAEYIDLPEVPAEEEKIEEPVAEEAVEEDEAPAEEDILVEPEVEVEIKPIAEVDDFDLDFDDAEIDAEDLSKRHEWLNK